MVLTLEMVESEIKKLNQKNMSELNIQNHQARVYLYCVRIFVLYINIIDDGDHN